MSQSPTPPSSLLPEQQEKLRELTAQSWNLELVISGAALFAVLQLPDLLDQAFDYFRYNLMSQTEGMQGLLPTMAYMMMKATCYVLFAAFLANFVMRAFWVGLVELLAVYPSGIHYDRIPFSTPYAQQRMSDELGPLDLYILRLDRRCNIVFAVAFLFVFLLIIVALAYLFMLVVYSIVKPLLPAESWQVIKLIAYGLFAVYLIVGLVLSLPKVRAHPTGIKLHYQFSSLIKIMFWGMHKPVLFIQNTFYSHLPYQKVLRAAAVMMGVFFVVVLIEFTVDLSRVDGRKQPLNQRHLYSSRLDSLFVNPTAYDNQRSDDEYVDGASVQADVIREPFIRLYIAYPKALDTLLTKVATEPVWDDALPRTEKRRLAAIWSSQQISHLIRISVNDSLYTQPTLLFTQLGERKQKGWQTVLMPANLKPGPNTLRLSIQLDSVAKQQEITTIPFWYVPEN